MSEKRKGIILASEFSSGHLAASMKIALLSAGIIIFVVIVGIFIGYRDASNKSGNEMEIPPDPGNADISLKRIRQTAARNGVREWSLDAESAQYFKASDKAILKNPSVVFFRKNRSDVRLSAKQGILHTSSNNIEAHGAVTVAAERYTLKTEKLAYSHKEKIIASMVPGKILKDGSFLEARKISINLKDDRTLFEGSVKCSLKEKNSGRKGSGAKKIYVTADRLTVSHATGYAEFTGNVRMSGEKIYVSSNRVKIDYKKDSGKKKLTLAEDAIDRITAFGDVNIKFDNRVAMSDKAMYIRKNRLLILTGKNATLVSDEYKVFGTRIALDMDRGHIKIEGNNDRRVKAVVFPGAAKKTKH